MIKPSRRARTTGVAALAVSVVLGAGTTGASAQPGFEFDRVAGDNRYGTAAAVAQEFGKLQDVTDVILTSGEQGRWPDALAANFLAGAEQAPVLLTKRDAIPEATQERLDALGPDTKVWVVGGSGVVSDAQVRSLRRKGHAVERVAGADRWATNSAVIAKGDASGDLGVVASGERFPDALAAGPLVYAEGLPLGLTKTDDVPDDVVQALLDAGVKRVLVVGGTSVVSAQVVAELRSKGISLVKRLAGSDRSATSAAVAEHAVAELDFDEAAVNVASGAEAAEGADALAGGPLSGEQRRPVLITVGRRVGQAVIDHLDAACGSLTTGAVFGGTGAVTAAQEREMVAAASCENRDNATVTADAQAVRGGTATVTVTGQDIETMTVSGPCAATQSFTPADDSDTAKAGHQLGVRIKDDAATGSCTLSVTTSFTTASGKPDETDKVGVQITSAQDFAVTGGGTTVAEGASVTYTVSGLPAGADYRIALAEADHVRTSSDGTVVFTAGTGNASGTADFGNVQADITHVDGDVIAPPGSEYAGKAPADGSVTITVKGAAGAEESVVPVVFVDGDGDGALDVDKDGRAVEKYGVGHATTFVNVSGVELTPATALRPYGGQHAVTAQLVGDDTDAPLPGQQVTFTVTRAENGGSPTTVLTRTVTTDESGKATLSYAGPADPSTSDDRTVDTIRASYDPDGADNGAAPMVDDATATWDDAAATAAAIEITQPTADTTATVGTRQAVTARVLDQYGRPMPGVTVTFEIDPDDGSATTTVTAPTDANGSAMITYRGPSAPRVDTVTAVKVNGDRDSLPGLIAGDPADLEDSVKVTWVAAAS